MRNDVANYTLEMGQIIYMWLQKSSVESSL